MAVRRRPVNLLVSRIFRTDSSHAGASGAVMDATELSVRELDALFDQSPVAMVFSDRELRTRRANAAFRQLTGIPEEALIGRRPSQTQGADRLVDTDLIERMLTGQVIDGGVPVVAMRLERP